MKNLAPSPKSKVIQLTVFKDASHGSDLTTRPSVTEIIIFLGHAPIKFKSKRMNTVETSTYVGELVAFCLAVEQLLDIRNKLRSLGGWALKLRKHLKYWELTKQS